jgi:hypothetical protein
MNQSAERLIESARKFCRLLSGVRRARTDKCSSPRAAPNSNMTLRCAIDHGGPKKLSPEKNSTCWFYMGSC